MMFLHNYGNLTPPNLNESPFTDGVNLQRSNMLSALPIFPSAYESDPFPGSWKFDNPYSLPPSQIVASLLAKTFRVSASLSAGSFAISLVNEPAPVKFGSTDILTIGERISDDYGTAQATLSESDSDGSDSLTFSFISIGPTIPLWVRADSQWSLSYGLSVSYSSDEITDTAVISNGESSTAYPETGITVTYFGMELPIYARRAEDLGFVTGTITIDASEYLSPL